MRHDKLTTKFQDALGDLPVTLREEKGRDINAACGQLRARELGR